MDEDRLKVVYKSTKGMEADGFSKPYDPTKHVPFAKLIQGEDLKVRQQVGARKNGKKNSKEELNTDESEEKKLNTKKGFKTGDEVKQ